MKIKQFTFCLTGSAVTKTTRHPHKRHHKSHHHVAQLPPHAKPSALPPIEEPSMTLPVFVNSNANAYSTSTKDSKDSHRGDNTLVVALSSAVGGFMAAIVLVVAVIAVKKRRGAAKKQEATEVTEDATVHSERSKSPHGVVSV